MAPAGHMPQTHLKTRCVGFCPLWPSRKAGERIKIRLMYISRISEAIIAQSKGVRAGQAGTGCRMESNLHICVDGSTQSKLQSNQVYETIFGPFLLCNEVDFYCNAAKGTHTNSGTGSSNTFTTSTSTTTMPATSNDSPGTCREAPARSRNLVVSIDGTSNQFGPNNTNVVELHSRIIKEDPSTPQLTFYQWIANIIDLAIAWNFEQRVQDAYRWLADHYQPGDVIYLFGFSRGAYQVRALAGMIATMGLVYSGNQGLIPFAYELYSNRHKGQDPIDMDRKEAEQLCSHFKKTFSRDVRLHFLGACKLWKTRCALALDECRVRFLPEYAGDERDDKQIKPQQPTQGTIKEVWFAGTHSDIGGGNRQNITLDLAGVPLLWMENEATIAGLHLMPRAEMWKWESLKQDKPIESLTRPFWWLLETIPLTRSTYNAENLDQTIRWPPHRGKGRVVMGGQLVHASVAFKDETYEPRASFSHPLRDAVRHHFGLAWNSPVGQGNLQDIQWAQSWRWIS
ncbi:hypothetical protein C8R44DRAFT_726392 [Mycena epipterygia]|nr:hypothetical protein C8R44DRAFT_726392 [Mycena epipterygia]